MLLLFRRSFCRWYEDLRGSIGVVVPYSSFFQGQEIGLPLQWCSVPLHSFVCPLECSSDGSSKFLLVCLLQEPCCHTAGRNGGEMWQLCTDGSYLRKPQDSEYCKSWNLKPIPKVFYLNLQKLGVFLRHSLFIERVSFSE